uniref:PH domain-containing protein n=1 Tax=Heterorhabditis bacteriophora TaxID=37862 RepID=A0A1I7XFW8_HETBA
METPLGHGEAPILPCLPDFKRVTIDSSLSALICPRCNLLVVILSATDGDSYNLISHRDDIITMHSGDKSIVIATPAKDNWMEDISTAVKQAAKCRFEIPPLNLEKKEENDMDGINGSKTVEQESSRSKLSPLQVCWHRRTTIGIKDVHRIVSNTQSGYLLRKLRNSRGWQKLWVVLANHTLFFFKSHEDDVPLASLPLIDYSIAIPNIEDQVYHENCFKLHYASHQYFFRTNNQYSFQRWLEAIRKAAISHNLDVLTALSLRI